MSRFSRRSFLAASAAVLARPALGARVPNDVDVAIIGAGAAGIAAARRVIAANRTCIVFEASDRIGGRCVTDTNFFGMPFDLGAHWIYNYEGNSMLSALRSPANLHVYAASRAQRLRVGPRNARDVEMENFFAGLVRASRNLDELANQKGARIASNAVSGDLGNWRDTIEFVLGPYFCGKDLNQVSAFDLARADKRDHSSFCREGYGTLLGKLAAGLPIRLSTPVTSVNWGNHVSIETRNGNQRAQAVIVTVSTNLLKSNKIVFAPHLPVRQRDAIAHLPLGSFDHIALEMPGNPFDLKQDDLVFEQANGPRTAALLANVSGSALHLVEVCGNFGRELSSQGEAAMIDFAAAWLTSVFGFNVKRSIRHAHATRWNNQEWVLGAMSAAVPGGETARHVLMEPLKDRLYFAGEAVHETKWGTVTGAWESGTRAAEAALRGMGVLKSLPVDSRQHRSLTRHRRNGL